MTDDLRTDPVTGDGHEVVLGHGSSSATTVGLANAGPTPEISAPWSLLAATR